MGRFLTDFRVGVFVLAALAVGGALLVTLGPGLASRQTIPLETYIEESVQGLEVGSPVKQRGVQIGKVASIGFVRAAYEIPADSPLHDRLSRLILVRVNIDQSILRAPSFGQSEAELARLIEDGLRVRLASQGITGQAYLEVDFVSPKRNPAIPIPWKPDALYIPSTASTISRLTSAAETLVNNLQQADIARMIREGTKLLDEVRETNEGIRQIVASPAIPGIESDAAAGVGACGGDGEGAGAGAVRAGPPAAGAWAGEASMPGSAGGTPPGAASPPRGPRAGCSWLPPPPPTPAAATTLQQGCGREGPAAGGTDSPASAPGLPLPLALARGDLQEPIVPRVVHKLAEGFGEEAVHVVAESINQAGQRRALRVAGLQVGAQPRLHALAERLAERGCKGRRKGRQRHTQLGPQVDA